MEMAFGGLEGQAKHFFLNTDNTDNTDEHGFENREKRKGNR